MFSRKKPTPGLTYIQVLGRIDHHGGFAVFETNDPTAVIKEAAMFQPYFEYEIYPVVEIGAFQQASIQASTEHASIVATRSSNP